jgi:uncharacterized protein
VRRPVGALVYLRKGTVNLRLVGLMTIGSVPMAFLGAYLLKLLGDTSSSQKNVEILLGAALLAGAAATVVRYILDRKSGPRTGQIAEVRMPLPWRRPAQERTAPPGTPEPTLEPLVDVQVR